MSGPGTDRDVALAAWTGGDRQALDALLPSIYDDLRVLARRYLRRERGGHTLQTTALVHEAYMRLVGQRQVDWSNRAQFLGVAAQMMRRVLVNYATARRADKRGGPDTRVTLDELNEPGAAPDIDVLALHEALQQLEALDPRQGQIVELRYFGGMSIEEIGRMLDLSRATVNRDLDLARRWLHRRLAKSEDQR